MIDPTEADDRFARVLVFSILMGACVAIAALAVIGSRPAPAVVDPPIAEPVTIRCINIYPEERLDGATGYIGKTPVGQKCWIVVEESAPSGSGL